MFISSMRILFFVFIERLKIIHCIKKCPEIIRGIFKKLYSN